jgi:hypothetical protein
MRPTRYALCTLALTAAGATRTAVAQATAPAVPRGTLPSGALPGASSGTVPAALPAAETLLHRFRRAVRADALAGARSLRTTGTFAMPAAGLTAPMLMEQVAPNRMRLAITVPGAGEMLQGFDGVTGWSVEPTQGPRVLAGAELAQLRDEADLGAGVRAPGLLRAAETVKQTEMGGVPCYLVKLAWRSGRETHDCYAVDSGLLVGGTATQQTPMGGVEITMLYSDYRDFAGVRLPARTVVQAMGQEQVITLTAVERDAVTTDLTALPPAIRALAGRAPAGSTPARSTP